MAHPRRVGASAAWNRATNATATWKRLREQASTDEQRACIAAATRQADRVWIALHTNRLLPSTDPAGAPVPARTAAWHRIALSEYEVLHESGGYGHLAQLRPLVCAAAAPVLASWLTSTNGDGATVAQRLGVGDAVHAINADTQIAHLSALLSAAQDDAVFGIPRHRVELVAAPGRHDTSTAVRVLIDTPSGLALASPPLDLAVLTDTALPGVEGAVAALGRVATIATGICASYARTVWQAPPPMPVADRSATPTGRAFPELRLHLRAAPPVPTTPAIPPSPPVPPRPAAQDSDRTGRSR